MVVFHKLQAIWMFSFTMIGTRVLQLVQFSQTKHFLHKGEFIYIHNNLEEYLILQFAFFSSLSWSVLFHYLKLSTSNLAVSCSVPCPLHIYYELLIFPLFLQPHKLESNQTLDNPKSYELMYATAWCRSLKSCFQLFKFSIFINFKTIVCDFPGLFIMLHFKIILCNLMKCFG